jgi:hypothetical protein
MRWLIIEFSDGNIDLAPYDESSEKLLRTVSDGFIYEFESENTSRWKVLREYFENKLILMCKSFDESIPNRTEAARYYGIDRSLYYRYLEKNPQLLRSVNNAMKPNFFQIDKLERLSRELNWYRQKKENAPKFRASRPRKK